MCWSVILFFLSQTFTWSHLTNFSHRDKRFTVEVSESKRFPLIDLFYSMHVGYYISHLSNTLIIVCAWLTHIYYRVVQSQSCFDLSGAIQRDELSDALALPSTQYAYFVCFKFKFWFLPAIHTWCTTMDGCTSTYIMYYYLSDVILEYQQYVAELQPPRIMCLVIAGLCRRPNWLALLRPCAAATISSTWRSDIYNTRSRRLISWMN